MALTHEKVGHTGQGLWHDPKRQLPAYIQHIANDLISERGMSESTAIATAISMCKKWAAGGKDVHPDTRAKAAAAIAEWERLKAGAHAKRDTTVDDAWVQEAIRAWDPAKHKRAPKGTAAGGQFAAGSSGAAPTNAHPVGTGERGQRTSDLQKRLNALGAHLAVDGIFGPKTRAAVVAFQKAHGLKPDGLVGPLTTKALRARGGRHHAAHHHHHAAHHAKPPAKTPVAKPAARPAARHPAVKPVSAKRSEPVTSTSSYDADGLDESWDGDYDLPDLHGLTLDDLAAADGGTGPTEAGRAAKLGSGARFKALKAKLAAKGASDPGALAAHIGRKKYGRKRFAALASKARSGKGGARRMDELFRTVPLEDYHIVRVGDGDGSGRVVEAYMTVFDEPVEIRDHQGVYRENIDRAAFNKRLADLERSRGGWAACKVLYNHAMTVHGTPSDRYSMPVAVCESIRVDTRGPITRSRYLDTPLGNEVLEMWRSGAITAQSFTGRIVRSDPELRPGQRYAPRNGQLPLVRRLELGLKEFGPTPFPAYQGAELVGVRMSPLGTYAETGDDAELLDDEALPPDEEAAPGGPQDVHPTRDHAHRLLVTRMEDMCARAGLVLPGRE